MCAADVKTSFDCEFVVAIIKHCYAMEFHENLHFLGKSQNDKHALKKQQQTVCYVGDLYEIGLLWVRGDITFKNNPIMAIACLKCFA